MSARLSETETEPGPSYQLTHAAPLQLIEVLGAMESAWTSRLRTLSALPATSNERYCTVVAVVTENGPV